MSGLIEPVEGCCTGVGHDLPEERVARDVRVLSAAGSETRYALLRSALAADGEVCACEFVPLVDASQSTVSRALSALHEVGLLTRRKEGRWRYYGPTERAKRLCAALDEVER
ncbi:ArsR/SmtB family transcription factor [Natronorarus salvus]|uniref:ArsR/SmtB family transcription factor n=1 Tax=Natronorarus salvus TaxID=3117733 RepID=UPI002F26B07D